MSQNSSYKKIANYVFNLADETLRGSFKRHEYGDVIIPFTILRRLDAILEKDKENVVELYNKWKKKSKNYEEIILNKATSTNYDREVETRNPEKISENRQLYEILCNELDEESVNIWIFSAQGFSSLEIAKKLNINHNTIRTKWKAIRLKAMSILKKSENSYGN